MDGMTLEQIAKRDEPTAIDRARLRKRHGGNAGRPQTINRYLTMRPLMEYDPDMAKKELLSDQLRRAIEESELTRYAIHKATGVDQSVLSKFVRGERGLSMDTMDLLGKCLGLQLVAERKSTGKRTTKKGG